MQPFEVTILGSNSAIPAHSRHPTAQVLSFYDRLFLIDCGEGTQIQLSRYKVKRNRIRQIFISHLHGDHYFGLMGLITSYHLNHRNTSLQLFGPPGLRDIIELHLKLSKTELSYSLEIIDIDASKNEVIYEDDTISVSTLPMNHRIPCAGFLFKEKPAGRKINKENMDKHDIPLDAIAELRAGKDFKNEKGNVIPNSELTLDPHPTRSYAFCSDTAYNPKLAPMIKGADLLYHEATFDEESADRATETFHSTATQAGMIADKAGVKKLIIGHFSAKYKDPSHLLDEARKVFKQAELAEEGLSFKIG